MTLNRSLVLAGLVACGDTSTDPTDDTDAAADACCVPTEAILEEVEGVGGDVSAIESGCAQFNDATTFPGTVGQELCLDLMEGRWCEWTCD